MLRFLKDPSQVDSAVTLRRRLAGSQVDFSPSWLAPSGALVVARESGRHLEPDEAVALAGAYVRQGVDELVAVVNDSLVDDDIAAHLSPTVADLNVLADEYSGMNFLLADVSATCCILFTVDDFKLIAGRKSFLVDTVGDLRRAKEEFDQFVEHGSIEELRDVHAAASEYMRWIV